MQSLNYEVCEMSNLTNDWVKERLQICSLIEYMDSINDGSKEAVDKLQEISLEVQVGSNELKMKLDRNSFNSVYNMLLELRNINASKRR